MIEGIIGPKEVLLRRIPRVFPGNVNTLAAAVILKQGLGGLPPLPLVTARPDLLQAGSFQVKKIKDILHITCWRAGDKAEENAQKKY